ncbi:glycosyltransferase family 2 protein [Spizellomyces punctatus DAOM BR117]|uniref:Glycosyltransferase family 2 protein n=1 Tax=Spizellomyces punctatus (strain DAOM BR117) TaxID=645134 RepID=A0A0L0HRU8_SPIPD|nr:glycosyltransferase family 2 protein [Spizellomyces punctatus DAOM BR117]KND03817.1 glycosyltransferase family 2 protein [Spizellomyces punctatus DAOM BR117]|eukprot:XP_016611856.1 glycosyltransferase family 2 protein [Spizellomyces punctatus DAOM BR117]
MFYLTKEALPVFLPLGFIGIYRWFWFLIKILAYCLYKPLKPRQHPRYIPARDVTVVVPTIDSGEEIKVAIRTWLRCDPYEVIFVTVPSARDALNALAREVDPSGTKVRVITISKPNKRNQMVAGANRVRTPITVFCDDDVLWPETMLRWMLAPFENKMMGGVGTSQRVLPQHKYMTIWEILAAFRISMRNIEITSTTYIDGGVCCLSGRTAAYRTCILRDPDFQWSFTHEFWLGKYHQHSGDDKFLTRWIHSHNWRTYIQACPEAELSSTFKDNWRFLKQLLRWTRNTWRSDSRSLFTERYVWVRHPFVAFTMLDKFFNPITLLAGPATVAYLATCSDEPGSLPLWVVLTSYLVWLFVTRLIKYMPHFVRRPQDVFAIPIWLIFNIYFAIMKIYCLFTLHVTDWGTRDGADDGKGAEDELDIFRPRWTDKDEENASGAGGVPNVRMPSGPYGVAAPGPALSRASTIVGDHPHHGQQERSGRQNGWGNSVYSIPAPPDVSNGSINLSVMTDFTPPKSQRGSDSNQTVSQAGTRSTMGSGSDATKTEERNSTWSAIPHPTSSGVPVNPTN